VIQDFKIHHVSINVCDLLKSQSFYQFLGFIDCYNYCSDDGGVKIVHLIKNNFIIELFSYSCAPTNKTISCNVEHSDIIGIDHFSLQTDNIEKAYILLKKYMQYDNGIQVGRTGIRFFFIIDPDGNRIEVVEDKRLL